MSGYNAPPPPAFFGSGGGGYRTGDTITQLLARRGDILADASRRSSGIWDGAIDNIQGSLMNGLSQYEQNAQQERLGNAMTEAMGPGTTTRTPGQDVNGDPTADTVTKPPDIQAILGKMPPEERQKAAASIQAVATQAQTFQQHQLEIEKTRGELKAQDDASKQHLANVVGTFGLGIEQHLKDPDGGILLAHSGLDALSNAKVPVDRLQPFAAQAYQAYSDAANDPQKQAQIVAAWRQQVGPMIETGKAQMTPAALKDFVETQKALADQHKGVSLSEGSTLVDPITGKTIATGTPKPDTSSLDVRLANAKPGTPEYAELLQKKRDEAAAGRDPSADAAPTMSPAAIEMAALRYKKDGTLPPMGMGGKGANVRQVIMNRAATLTPDDAARIEKGGGDIANNKANFAADSASLKALQKQTDAVSAFESTASKNGKLFEDALTKMPDAGMSILNKPLREAATVFGSEDMARINTLRQSVQNEYARMLSSPGLSGTMSDSARKEGEALLSGDATVGQLRAALATFRAEAANRHTSYQEQIAEINKRMGGGPAAPAPATGIPTVEVTATGPGGQKLVLRNGKWVVK